MLQNIPNDVLRMIIGNVTNIQDLQSLSRTSKSLNAFILTKVQCVTIHLNAPHKISLKFLPKIKGLKQLTIKRVYSSELDLGVVQECSNLSKMTINSRYRVINIPSRITVVEDMRLGKMIRPSSSGGFKAQKKNDECNKLLTPKEYFQSRYNTRFGKYGNKKFSCSI